MVMKPAIFANHARAVNGFVHSYNDVMSEVMVIGDGAAPASSRKVRLDKWLWAARFYKTRSAASDAIDGGKIDIAGTRARRSRLVRAGEAITVRRPPFVHEIVVRAVAEVRGSATVAATLYEETPASKQARETLAYQLKNAPTPSFKGGGRPSKRDRRELERIKQED
jgi:ribosome-associated heat shock protein Hsp15